MLAPMSRLSLLIAFALCGCECGATPTADPAEPTPDEPVELSTELEDDAPDMFLVDLQPDQIVPAEEQLMSLGARDVRMVPVLRARVTGVQGRDVVLDGYEQVREERRLRREFTVTYRNHLEANETILDGRFWDDTPSTEAEVSIEEDFQEDVGIQVGDVMRFDILGRHFDEEAGI